MKRSFTFAAALCLSAGSALAQDADAIIARAREATGIEHLTQDRAVRLRGKGEMAGLPMDFEMIFDGKGRFVQRFTGPITVIYGFDGANAWTHDIGGEERVLDLRDRRTVMAAAAFVSGWWLHPASGATLAAGSVPGSVEWRGSDDSTAEAQFDASTGMPSAWSAKASMGRRSSTLSGVVTLGEGASKMAFPAKIETVSDGAGTVTITSAESYTPTDAEFTLDPSRGKDARFDPSRSPTLEVTKAKTGHMLVHVTINDQDAGLFIFDTGAGGTVISKALAQKLKLDEFGEVPMVGVGGAIKSTFVRPASMNVGPMTIDKPLMNTLDTGFLTQAMGTEISGIIGYGLMHRAIVEVDRANLKVALHDPDTFKDDALHWQELRVSQRVPVAKCTFEGHEGWFRLDTGASGPFATIHQATVKQFNLLEGREVTDTQMGGVGGKVPAKRGTLKTFTIGGRTSENVTADFSLEDKGAFAEATLSGNLGMTALSGFDIFFDYHGKRVAFVAGKP